MPTFLGWVTGSAPRAQAGGTGGVPLGCKLWGPGCLENVRCKSFLLLIEEAGLMSLEADITGAGEGTGSAGP